MAEIPQLTDRELMQVFLWTDLSKKMCASPENCEKAGVVVDELHKRGYTAIRSDICERLTK